MSHYKVDIRDIKFVLFDYLNVGDLCKYPKFSEHDPETMKMVIDEAIKFADSEVAPLNEISDRQECHIENGQVIVPEGFVKAYKQFVENGWLGVSVKPNYGGQGFPECIGFEVMEVFCGACVAFTMYVELTTGAARMIDAFGTEEQRQNYVSRMFSGEWAGTMCLTEPGAGSDVGALKTTAFPNGDGTYRIVGTKIFISSGDHPLTENIIHPVLARIEGDPKGVKGISLFLVPKYRVNDDGSLGELNDIITTNVEHKMGIKGSATCTLNFGDNNKCIGYLIGEPQKGIVYMFQMMNEARLYVGTQAMALANTASQNSIEYAKERIQFCHVTQSSNPDAARVPIVEHPDVRRMLMFSKSMSQGLRGLLLKCAYYIDRTHVAEDPDEKDKYQSLVDFMIPVCKAYSSDQSFRVTETAIQVYGGYGFCQEYPVEQYCRDCKITSLYEGTNGIQALDLLGRKMSIKGGKLFMYYLQDLSEAINKAKASKLAALAVKLEEAQENLASLAMSFPGYMKKQDLTMLLPVLNATPFLEIMGQIMVSHVHLEMAMKAQEMLDELFAQKGASSESDQRKLIEMNDEAKYLYGKIQSAKWFINNILPHHKAFIDAFNSKDISPLEMVF